MAQESLFSGEALRDEGMSRVLENAGDAFKAHVYNLIWTLPEGWTGTGEDIRMMASVYPHRPQAWGAIINAAGLRGWLRPTGQYRKMRQRSSHARETRVYVRTERQDS